MWPRRFVAVPEALWSAVAVDRADVTAEMIGTGRRHFPEIPVLRADAAALPFGNQTFDVVVLRHVLEHLPAWLITTLRAAIRWRVQPSR